MNAADIIGQYQQTLDTTSTGDQQQICVPAQGGTDANGNPLPDAAQCAAMPTLAGCANVIGDFIHNPGQTISGIVGGAINAIGGIFGL